jgi:hypothetical protein
VPVPQELPQIPVLPTRYPDLWKITREQEVQNMQWRVSRSHNHPNGVGRA